MLELLTLAVGPFRGVLGKLLAKAVARQPGIGGQEWLRQKERAMTILRESHASRVREREGKDDQEAMRRAEEWIADRVAPLHEWLEGAGFSREAAPKAGLLTVAERVRSWLADQLLLPNAERFVVAYAHAEGLCDVLMKDPRLSLSYEDARALLDTVARGAERREIYVEEAGRIAHVSHPSRVLSTTDTILVFGAIGSISRRPKPSPWNAAERSALAAAGIALPDESVRLQSRAVREMFGIPHQ